MGAVCCNEQLIDLDGEVDLSHFVLLRSVGKGAFGKVRVVQHRGTKELFALKYINKAKCIQMKAVDNIISERRLLEQITSNVVVNLRYAFQDDKNMFMVLDLMLGGDLRFHLERFGTMPEERVRFYAAEISLGLNYLHSKNIVHRDIKPDNILLDEQGHAYLTDFNIAVQYTEGKQLTSIAGSMAYMAPEVLQKRGYYASVDWWSLGVMCYELLFGKRPFRGKSNDMLHRAILYEQLVILEQKDVSPEAVDFVKGLLTRDIDSRLGVKEKGFNALLAHPWFTGLDWEALKSKTAIPPFIPDSKRANFDPTHELEEILMEDYPLKVRRRNPKRSGTGNTGMSIRSQTESFIEEAISPEEQVMEEKFLTYDYTRPHENERRKDDLERKRWAQKMSKTNGEKPGIHTNTRKVAGTYKASVLEYLNQKPVTPLTAGDILKLEELARITRAGGEKEKNNGWRPPSGILSHSPPDGSNPIDAVRARDNYILQSGGVPPPSRPPPIVSNKTILRFQDNNHSDDTLDNGNNNSKSGVTAQSFTRQSLRRRSSDASYDMPSPENSYRPLIAPPTPPIASSLFSHAHKSQIPNFLTSSFQSTSAQTPKPAHTATRTSSVSASAAAAASALAAAVTAKATVSASASGGGGGGGGGVSSLPPPPPPPRPLSAMQASEIPRWTSELSLPPVPLDSDQHAMTMPYPRRASANQIMSSHSQKLGPSPTVNSQPIQFDYREASNAHQQRNMWS